MVLLEWADKLEGRANCSFFCPFWLWLLLWECRETGMVVVIEVGRVKVWTGAERIS